MRLRDRDREPLGIGRRLQAGRERVAVAVVGRARELARDEPAAEPREPDRERGVEDFAATCGVDVAPGLRTVT